MSDGRWISVAAYVVLELDVWIEDDDDWRDVARREVEDLTEGAANFSRGFTLQMTDDHGSEYDGLDPVSESELL